MGFNIENRWYLYYVSFWEVCCFFVTLYFSSFFSCFFFFLVFPFNFLFMHTLISSASKLVSIYPKQIVLTFCFTTFFFSCNCVDPVDIVVLSMHIFNNQIAFFVFILSLKTKTIVTCSTEQCKQIICVFYWISKYWKICHENIMNTFKRINHHDCGFILPWWLGTRLCILTIELSLVWKSNELFHSFGRCVDTNLKGLLLVNEHGFLFQERSVITEKIHI